MPRRSENPLLRLVRWAAPVLLVLLILGEAGLSWMHESSRLWYPPETHHDGFMKPILLERAMQGWSPVEKECVPGNCYAGYADPPQGAPRSLWERTRWIWDSGPTYINDYPLCVLPSAVAIAALPGTVYAPWIGLRGWKALLLLSAYLLGQMLRGPLTGLLSAVLCAGTPGLFGLGLVYQDSVPLAAVGTALAAALLATRGFERRWACGAVAVLTFAAFRVAENVGEAALVAGVCIAPFCAAVLQGLTAPGDRSRRWDRFELTLAPAAVIAIRAGMLNADALRYVREGVETAGPYGWAKDFAWIPIPELGYIEELGRDLLRPPMAIVLSFGALLLLRRPSRDRLAVLGMHVVPLALLSFVNRKGLMYIVPALPALAVAASLGIATLSRRWRVRVALFGVAAAVWTRGTAVFLPDGLRGEVAYRLAHLDHLHPDLEKAVDRLRPINILDGMRIIPAVYARRAEAQAAVGIADVARLHQQEGEALRIALVSTSVHLAQATCWYIQVEAPNTTCFAPLWGGTVRASPMEVDPRRYDLLAWVEDNEGPLSMPLDASSPLPDRLVEVISRDQPDWQDPTRLFLERLHAVAWEAVPVHTGTVYVRKE